MIDFDLNHFRRYGSRIQLDTITSTVELTDDFEPVAYEHPGVVLKENITHTRYSCIIRKIPRERSGTPILLHVVNGNLISLYKIYGFQV